MPRGWQGGGKAAVINRRLTFSQEITTLAGLIPAKVFSWNFSAVGGVNEANPTCFPEGGEAMKKRIAIAFVALSLLLAACGGAAAPMIAATEAPAAAPQVYNESLGAGSKDTYQGSAPMPTPVAYDPAAVDTGSTNTVQERMVIMNADLTIVIPDPQAKAAEIEALAKSLGGYVVSMNMYQTSLYDGGTAPEGYISIRIPSDKLESALSQIKADVVKVRNEDRSSEDITASYVDLQSRLKALESARDQLQTIMDAATKTEDVLNVFNQLQYYNEQIEMVKGQMKYYEEATSTSLINVTLVAEETIQPLQIGPWTPKGAAQDAYKALINFLRGFVEFLIWLVVVVLPIIIIIFGPIALVIWLIVRGVRRRRAKKQISNP
jgi:Domain of unknown function (DUF4349)